MITKSLSENYPIAKKGILGAMELALETLYVTSRADAQFIEVSVTAYNRPFEVKYNFLSN